MESTQEKINHGDFTKLASNYAKFRPGYSPEVLKIILQRVNKSFSQMNAVDVGAGTGIWTRMIAQQGCRTTAVEPNDEMREHGLAGNGPLNIEWKKGSAEATGLPTNSFDLVTMASSFHWPDFNKAIREFHRILRPHGWFAAVWNPRLIEVNPILVEIENKLKELVPDLKRVSSGRSEFCAGLTDRLYTCGYFEEVIYLEGRHVERMTIERYLGVWRSVNDVRVQAGPERFEQFLDFIAERLKGEKFVEAMYLTRAWVARKKVK